MATAKPADTPDVMAELEVLRADMRKLAETLGEVAAVKAQAANDAAADAMTQAKAAGERQLARAKDMASTAATDAEEMIKANPASAVAIAAGAGFVVGMLTSLRR